MANRVSGDTLLLLISLFTLLVPSVAVMVILFFPMIGFVFSLKVRILS